ncbi:Uncharacterized conserved protein, DUF1330 family [Rhizobium tibeticum]|uniref:Uncharacterized conserved protein, DUF1330 family n=1 Tax=Rhizobium tibeticum TaxID=501024 RepID=A0A1H8U4Z9_9HYPH|nr:hypothetical protein RTCCBAU85039_5443 [Rhizobium tibeticum]SEO98136.1 Uncharacterized conserved protein, DUF1330 family [Rhizobium tibeticum]
MSSSQSLIAIQVGVPRARAAQPALRCERCRLIALDDAPLELEEWQSTNMLIIEFPDMGAIRGLFTSPEYAPLAHQRQAAAGSRIIALCGV